MILRIEMSLNFPGKKTDWKAKSVWMGTRSGTRMDMDTGSGAGVHRHKTEQCLFQGVCMEEGWVSTNLVICSDS